MKRELLVMAGVVAVFVAGGVALVSSGLLPEESARNFNALSNMTLDTGNIVVIKEPSAGDDRYIYAINSVAKQAWEIAEHDAKVQDILAQARGSAVTIAAVQPTAFIDPSGKVIHGGSGQVIITSNRQFVAGRPYADAESFSTIAGKQGESHQQIWNVFVDMDANKVTNISNESERVMSNTLRKDIVYGGMNMYMPDAAVTQAGSTVKWINESNVPHNVVGTYKTESGQTKNIDSGFFDGGESFQYNFAEKGTFEYHCTIHSADGMKGTIVVS